MAFELSFAPEFFVGPHDLEGVEFDKERPTSVYQALSVMPEAEWNAMAEEVFCVPPDELEIDRVMDEIREVNTCRDLRSPVEVYIDRDGWHSVLVYDSVGDEDGYTSQHVDTEKYERE